MKFGSLFSGIGGLDLGLERAGMTCSWQVEIDDYATRVLAKHWPNVPRFRDVREVGRLNLASVDIICGGFPCQDISSTGNRAGIEGEQSGLWSEFFRIICELRPPFVLVENVAALLVRGIDRVLGDLASRGYDAEWQCLPAAAFGAPHRRDRIFIVGYPQRSRLSAGIFSYPRSIAEMLAPRHRSPLGFEYGAAWNGEPELAVLVHGLPEELDAVKGYGNAVVPQVAEFIGNQIINHASL